MIKLPNECYYMIFNNFQNNSKSLFSCALVNRQWCRIIIPILWSEPEYHFKDIRLIKILLLMLKVEEKALLVPYKINFQRHTNPLFEYTNYIKSVGYELYSGVKKFLGNKKYQKNINEVENAIKCSLIAMILRTGKNLKYLYLDEIICNKIIIEKLYENTTITSIKLYDFNDKFKPKAINELVKILYKNSTLTSLNLESILFGFIELKTLLEAFYENTILNSLSLCIEQIDTEEGKMLATFLSKNTTLTSFNLCGYDKHWFFSNNFGLIGGIAFANALYKNTTLTSLCLWNNKLGPED
ncbi:protein NLRC3-like [Gigaspora margarita]|uniref:Protein NLRC3-like n=1 Tax=Gigaspora margarita TaxID=4874 RepID=A0A8H4AYN7_GIGMA|nr:protein NLRC3-like [Gigaspora margarita]